MITENSISFLNSNSETWSRQDFLTWINETFKVN